MQSTKGYDFNADAQFFKQNYEAICRFHQGRTIVIKECKIVMVLPDMNSAYEAIKTMGALGMCSIKNVTGRKAEDVGPIFTRVYGHAE